MAEEGKVRLVRCPKCENVLPELSYYSVYQCGGCGAVLRAKSRSLKAESISVGIADVKKEDDEVQKSDYFSEEATVTVTEVDDGKYSPKGSDASNPTGFEISGGESATASVEEEESRMMNSSSSNVLNSSRSMAVTTAAQLDSGDPSSVITPPLISTKKLSTAPINEEDNSHISANLPHSPHQTEKDVLMNQEGCSAAEIRSPTANLYPKSLNNLGGSLKNNETMASFNKIERATLLRKVEELKEKLTQTCDLVDKQREEAPCSRRMVHMGLPSPPGSVNTSFQHLYNHNQVNQPSSCYNTELYGDNRSQLLKISPNSAPCHHENRHLPPSHLNFSENYTSSCSNPCSQYTYNAALPCSSCSYVHHDRSRCPVARGLPHGGFSDVKRNMMNGNQLPRCSNQHYDGDGRCGKRHLRPVAGAAPFITCCHCSELLQIPNKVIGMGKKKRMARARCGCCSKVMLISIIDQRVVVSADVEIRHNPEPEANGNRGEGCGGGMDTRRGNTNLCYGDSGYDFQWADGEPARPTGRGFDSGKSEEMHSLRSSSGRTSFGEEFQDEGAVVPVEVVGTAELGTVGAGLSPPPPASPVRGYLEQGGGRFERGNRSTRCDQEKVKTTRKTSRQNSLKESELEIPISDYPDVIAPHDSKPHQISSSFFAGIIKKSFKYNHAGGAHGKSCVDINGHAISHRAARKAERMAGPIYPGKYWYDMKAGFWGVMGGPCLGIISPYIEEFSYPMAVDCSNGNTLVFVNGRELHKKDMDLLASRGLPARPHMSYSVDISGKVVDLDSGVELHSLGKLAPTVEKMKRGFGMKVPMAPV